MKHLVAMPVVAVVVLIASRVVPGVRVRRLRTALAVGVVFGILHALIGWLVGGLLLAAGFLTFGLTWLFFGLLLNAVLLTLVDKVVDGFELDGFTPLWITSGLVSVASWVVQLAR